MTPFRLKALRIGNKPRKEVAIMLSITYKDLIIQVDSNTLALLYIVFLT